MCWPRTKEIISPMLIIIEVKSHVKYYVLTPVIIINIVWEGRKIVSLLWIKLPGSNGINLS